jgi:hypothetical protein
MDRGSRQVNRIVKIVVTLIILSPLLLILLMALTMRAAGV